MNMNNQNNMIKQNMMNNMNLNNNLPNLNNINNFNINNMNNFPRIIVHLFSSKKMKYIISHFQVIFQSFFDLQTLHPVHF